MGLIPSQGTKTMPHHAAKIEKKKYIYIYTHTHIYLQRPKYKAGAWKKSEGGKKSLQIVAVDILGTIAVKMHL